MTWRFFTTSSGFPPQSSLRNSGRPPACERAIRPLMTCSIMRIVIPCRLTSLRSRISLVDLRGSEPGHHLIQEEELRFGRQGPCQLQPLSVREGQPCCQAYPFSPVIQPIRSCFRAFSLASLTFFVLFKAATTTFSRHGELKERLDELKCPDHPSLTDLMGFEIEQILSSKPDLSCIRRERTR